MVLLVTNLKLASNRCFTKSSVSIKQEEYIADEETRSVKINKYNMGKGVHTKVPEDDRDPGRNDAWPHAVANSLSVK